MQTLEYLLQIPSVKAATNTRNQNGFTALDVLEVYPIRDMKFMEIRDILVQAGVQRTRGQPLLRRTTTDQPLEPPPPPPPSVPSTPTFTTAKITTKARELISHTWKKYFKIDDKWLEDARGNLILSASVIASMAFQGALNPPGGVWQDYNNGATQSNGERNRKPGTSIAGSYNSFSYHLFSMYNTVSLMASLVTILLAISGFPLKNRLAIWLLMSAMCTSVGSLALAYLFAMEMVTPDNRWDQTGQFYNGVSYTWLGICGIVLLIHTIRFFAWLQETRPRFFRIRSIAAKLLKH